MRPYITLTTYHINQPEIRAFGKYWPTQDFIGNVQPRDVGKRVYLVGDILQVENDEQRAKRLAE